MSDAGDDIELLQQVLDHGGTQAFEIVPLALAKVITERQWHHRKDKRGNEFASFEAFVISPLWHGLETTIDDLRVFCRKRPDVVKLILAEMEPEREHRGSTKDERDRGDNITSSKRGTSAIYTLKRLKRDRPDLFQQVLGGGMSANEAALEAGFRKKPIRRCPHCGHEW